MNIEAVIVDKVPISVTNCPLCKELSLEISPYTDKPVMVVDCSIYVRESYVKPFNNFLERCPFCPLTAKEDYKAKLEVIG